VDKKSRPAQMEKKVKGHLRKKVAAVRLVPHLFWDRPKSLKSGGKSLESEKKVAEDKKKLRQAKKSCGRMNVHFDRHRGPPESNNINFTNKINFTTYSYHCQFTWKLKLNQSLSGNRNSTVQWS
jgi:hypothetical protein